MIFFLVANSKDSNSDILIEKIKNLTIREKYCFVFFNRFVKDLKNPFWINFINNNNKATLLFASRMTSIAKDKNTFPNNKKSGLWGLYGEECISSDKHKLDNKFNKILIFAPCPTGNSAGRIETVDDFYYTCPKELFKKSVHINKFSPINISGLKNPSTGLLMYGFIRKFYPKSMVYLVGFEHKGLEKFHKFDLEKDFFEKERASNFNLKIF